MPRYAGKRLCLAAAVLLYSAGAAQADIRERIAEAGVVHFEGQVTCSGPYKASEKLAFAIYAPKDGRYDGVLQTFGGKIASASAYVGEFLEDDQAFFFAHTRRRGWHDPRWMKGRTVLVHPGDTPSFEFEGLDYCKVTGFAERDARGDPENTLTKAADGGSFWAGKGARGKCGALIEWGKHYDDLPKLSNGQAEDVSLLYADSFFVPVFGKPFDTYSFKDYQLIYQNDLDYMRLCTDDPLIGARFDLADEVMRHSLHGNYHSHIHQVVRDNRLAEAKIAELLPGDEPLSPDELEVNEKAVKRIVDESGLITKARGAKFATMFGAARGHSAIAEADAYLARLSSAETSQQRIALATQWTHQKPGYRSALPQEKHDAVLAAAVAVVEREKTDLLAPLLSEAETLPSSLEGLRRAEEIIDDDLPKAVGQLLARDRKDKDIKRLQRIQDRIAAEALDAEIGRLATQPPGAEGLAASLEWREAFSRDFGPLIEKSTMTKVMAAWGRDRAGRLGAALDEFRAKLANVDGAAAAKLLHARYIAVPFDQAQPVSLEYELFLLEKLN